MKEAVAALGDGGTVVTANSRLAGAVRAAFNRAQLARGRAAWPTPVVLPWSDWLRRLWRDSLARGGTAGEHVLLADHQASVLWRDIVGRAPQGLLAGPRPALATLAARAWQLATAWRLLPAEIAAAADSDDARAFAAWTTAYLHRCRRARWADLGQITPLLLADFRTRLLPAPERLHLLGFIDRTPLQDDTLRVLSSLGTMISEEPPASPAPARRVQLPCHDGGDELDRAARWARQRKEAEPAASVAVVIPDLAARIAAVRRAFLDIAAPDWRLQPDRPLPVDFSYAEPLAAAGLAQAALLVLRALQPELDYRDAGALLASRYVAGHEREVDERARLDLVLRDRITTAVPVADMCRLAGSVAPIFGRVLGNVAAIGRGAPLRQAPAGWARIFRGALDAAGWPGDDPLGSADYQASSAWQDVIGQFESCDAAAGPLDLRAALALLETLAEERSFQPRGRADAIQVLGALEAAGQRFDALWVCAMTSDVWPPATGPDPLLPLSLQRERHMPGSSPPVVRERSERLLRWLESAAPEVIFSWPQFVREEPLTVSPLVAALPVISAAALASWDRPKWSDAILASADLELDVPDPPPPVPAGARLRGGAALLERQARCPARAFIEFRLGATAWPEPAAGIDGRRRGAIVHRVLEQFFARYDDQEKLLALDHATTTRMVDDLTQATLQQLLPMGDPLVRALAAIERTRVTRLLTEFLASERQREPFAVMRLEAPPGGARIPASVAALGIRLRADRIDQLGDGRRLVIDYKTGRTLPAAGELHGPRPRAPQLPLYAMLADAHAIAFAQIATGRVCWMGTGMAGWGIEGLIAPVEFTRKEVADWDALRASWCTALDGLAEEILRGSFRIDRWRPADAEGEWAMAIRPFDLGNVEEPDE